MTNTYTFLEKDINIILDALELLYENMKNKQKFGLPNDKEYNINDVDSLFQSLDNSHTDWDAKIS